MEVPAKLGRLFQAFAAVMIFLSAASAGESKYGWMEPAQDLYVEEGMPYEFTCGLNPSTPGGSTYTWKDIALLADGLPVDRSLIEKVDDVTVRYSVKKSAVAPQDYHIVQCSLDGMAIGLRYVYVGYMPANVSDFQCTVHNWERMVCTWKPPYNPVPTDYELSYKILNQTRKSKYGCPSSNGTSSKSNSCIQSGSPYRKSAIGFDFTMSIKNALKPDGITQYLGTIDNYAIMVPNKMEGLRVIDVASYSVHIGWIVPWELNHFPPGLLYRIRYKIASSWPNDTIYASLQEVDTSHVNSTLDAVNMTITLPFANCLYEIQVSARSAKSDVSQEKWWSETSSLSVKTAPDVPCSSPVASRGSFEVTNSRLEERSVLVRWSPLPAHCLNGDSFSYEIDVLGWQDGYFYTRKVAPAGTSSVKIDHLDLRKGYHLRLKSRNAVGHSANYTEVFLPMANAMPAGPENVLRISYGASLYEIQWSPVSASKSVSLSYYSNASNYETSVGSYTVYWCKIKLDFKTECQGELNRLLVPSTETSVNITVPDVDSNYQFAVQANQGNYSSGMVWSNCMVIVNGNGSQIKDVDVVAVTDTTIQLAWTIPCSTIKGVIIGFDIYYCTVNEGKFATEIPTCSGALQIVQVDPGARRYEITQLKPYTTYKISMAIRNRGGEGEPSEPHVKRTNEGKPSAPLNLSIWGTTKNSAQVSWSPPKEFNGKSVQYLVYLNNLRWNVSQEANVSLSALDSFTSYNVSVQACHGEQLCSDFSQAVPVKTLIGQPSQPGKPVVDIANSTITVSWAEPSKISSSNIGYYSIICNYSSNEHVRNVSTNQLQMADSYCLPGRNLATQVMAVNVAEDGQHLHGPWSEISTYRCPPTGMSLAQLLGIVFGAAGLVIVIIGSAFFARRVQLAKKKANNIAVKLPWEHGGDQNTFHAEDKMTSLRTRDNSSFAINNHYGRLESKLSNDSNVTTVVSDADNKTGSSSSVAPAKSPARHSLAMSEGGHYASETCISAPTESSFDSINYVPVKLSEDHPAYVNPITLGGNVKSAVSTGYMVLGQAASSTNTSVASSPNWSIASETSQTADKKGGYKSRTSSGFKEDTFDEDEISNAYVLQPVTVSSQRGGYVAWKSSENLPLATNEQTSATAPEPGYVAWKKDDDRVPPATEKRIETTTMEPGYVALKNDDINLLAKHQHRMSTVEPGYVAWKTGQVNPSDKSPPSGYVTLGDVCGVNQTSEANIGDELVASNAHYVTLGSSAQL